MWYLHTLRTFPVNLIKLLYGYSKHELFSLAPKPQDISFKLKNYVQVFGLHVCLYTICIPDAFQMPADARKEH